MKKYAILIGNSRFPDETDKTKLPDLACPEKDVDGLSRVLASERGEFEVLSLINQPSYQILRELQRKVKQADSDDLLLLYYSGHGKPNKSGLLHLTTLDTVIAELETSAIPINRVYDILGTGKAKKIVILLDCCYSGAAGQGFKGAVDDQLQQLNNARGTYLMTASTELQVAHESAAEGLSLFTKHLIAGLETGEADKDGDGWVSMNELYDYVQGKVVAENPAQQPTKHVKEERNGLFIAKSGKERSEKNRSDLNTLLVMAIPVVAVLLFFATQPEEKPTQTLIPPPPIVHAFTSNKNGIAKDTKTDLMWLRFAYGQTWKNGTVDGNPKRVDWATALEVAKEFNQRGGYAGYTDWRLPTIDELKTLIDKTNGKQGNYINIDIFPNNFRWFWSSTAYDSESAWIVNFSNGDDYHAFKDYQDAVRLVRGGKPA